MMRNFAVALVAMTFLFAGNANASYTIDLIWSDSGTATLTVTPGDGAAAATGACVNGPGGDAAGRCLEVILTAAAALTTAVISLGWHSDSGIASGSTGLKSFGAYGGGFTGAAAVTPASGISVADCGVACDTGHGSFGGVSTSAIAGGTYTLGSINFDTSGTLAGIHNIIGFIRTGVGGVSNKKFLPSPVQINGAILNVVPEPGTASLLGLGIMGLVLAGRRRKA